MSELLSRATGLCSEEAGMVVAILAHSIHLIPNDMRTLIVSAGCAFAIAGCATADLPEHRAVAQLIAAPGSSSAGRVMFTERAGQLLVRAEVAGLRANAEHGMHVHEIGRCDTPDFETAGGHFNPAGGPHAYPAVSGSHAGDLPNVRSDARGEARYSAESHSGATLQSGPRSIIGRSIVIHRDADDYRSQPSGSSGPRIACGVIQAVTESK